MTFLTNSTEERKRTISEYLGLGLLLAQLLLIILVLREVDMLPLAFRRVVYVAAAGFIVHHLLPFRLRLTFFVLLSVGAMFLVLGTPTDSERLWDPLLAIPRAGIVVAIGAVLIGICHLPIGFWKRVGLLVAAAVAVGMFRVGILKSGGLEIIWIIVAALFMFRIIIYLYDLSTSKDRPSVTHSLAYFFLIPNMCCLLFPIIDFKTFCKSYYDDAPLAIYQRGVRWMGRGVIQLLIYRFVDQGFLNQASSVYNGTDLIRFLITNSLSYLGVSGQFHFIIGLLLLFGFNLPETNHRYFLASSFTDYWRRVNIYWKDFMMKIFYYPTFFKLKKRGPTQALVVAMFWVFFVTWALHLYQAWWLKGSIKPTKTEMIFWLMFGLLVTANSLWEMKHPRKHKIASSTYNATDAAWLALRTAGTFACVCVLWSLWSTPGVRLWVRMWKYADRYTLLWGVAVLAAIMLAKIVLEVLPTLWSRLAATSYAKLFPAVLFRREVFQCVAPLLVIYVLAQPAIQSSVDDLRLQRFYEAMNIKLHYLHRVFEVLETGDSIVAQNSSKEVNYYKQLTSVNESNRGLIQTLIGHKIPTTRDIGGAPTSPVKDFRLFELKPSVHVYAFQTDFQTNRWGMRDKDYEQAKPDGTLRIALLGNSHVMGWGVQQDEIFKTVVEDRLNREPPLGATHTRFEILNFGHYGYGPLSYISVLQARVRMFTPDLVLLVGHTNDSMFVNYSLRSCVLKGYPIPYGFLQQTLHAARVRLGLHDGLAEKRLKPFEPALIEWSYRQIVKECHYMGALPVYVFMPVPTELPLNPAKAKKIAMLTTLAAQADFIVVDLSHVFDNQIPKELLTAGFFPHSNPKAHALFADALYKVLTTDSRINLGKLACDVSIRPMSRSSRIQSSQ